MSHNYYPFQSDIYSVCLRLQLINLFHASGAQVDTVLYQIAIFQNDQGL